MPPSNDPLSAAALITGGRTPGTLAGAGTDKGEAWPGANAGTDQGLEARTVWYRYVAGQTGVYTFTLKADEDAFLEVYNRQAAAEAELSFAELTPVILGEGGSARVVSTSADEGLELFIQVGWHARSGADGSLSFDLEVRGPGAGNQPAVAAPPVNTLPAGSLSVLQDGFLVFDGERRIGVSAATDATLLDVTLSATHGTLQLGSSSGVAVAGDRSANITITGSQAAVTAALLGTRFVAEAGFVGPASVRIQTAGHGDANAGEQPVDDDALTITVQNVNDAPRANGLSGSLNLREDAGATRLLDDAVSVTDPDDGLGVPQQLTATLALDPAFGSLAGEGLSGSGGRYTATGTAGDVQAILCGITFKPAPDFSGTATVRLAVTDGGGTPTLGEDPSGAVTINVEAVADPARISGTSGGTVTEDDAELLTARGSLGIVDPDPGESGFASAIDVKPTNLGTLTLERDGSTATVLYRVANADVQWLGAGRSHTDTFTVHALDGTAHALAYTITGRNDPPRRTEVPQALAGTEDTSRSVDTAVLLAGFADPDVGDALTVTDVTVDSGTIAATDGGYAFRPADDTNGLVTIAYKVSDGHGSAVAATRTLLLQAVDDAPVAVDDSLAACEAGAARTILAADLLSNDRDVDTPAAALGLTAVTAVTGGSVTLSADRSAITFAPEAGFAGPASFSYVLSDGTNTGTATVRFTVTASTPASEPSGSGAGPATGGTGDGQGAPVVPVKITPAPGVDAGTGQTRPTDPVETTGGTPAAPGTGQISPGGSSTPVDATAGMPGGSSGDQPRAGDSTVIDDAPAAAPRAIITLAADTHRYLGGAGDDSVLGNAGDDAIFGDLGSDTLLGGEGADSLHGGQDSDWLSGGDGADVQFGNRGADILFGNRGADALFGGQGSDTLFGGRGDDTISGDRGDDVLSGDLGADRYCFAAGSGADTILGFDAAAGDRIDLSGQTYTLGRSASGKALLILSGGGTVEILGIAVEGGRSDIFV